MQGGNKEREEQDVPVVPVPGHRCLTAIIHAPQPGGREGGREGGMEGKKERTLDKPSASSSSAWVCGPRA